MAKKQYKVAVVGATGNVGREILSILAEREFPASEVVALASRASQGREISYGEDKVLKVQALENYDFAGTQIVLASAGSAVSEKDLPRAAAAGAVVIDNASFYRMDVAVPLVVPEVNAAALQDFKNKNIIANPNCVVAQLVVALKPLHNEAEILRICLSTYQSVSGAGKDAMDELFRQTRAIYVNDPVSMDKFPKQIAFNVIPQVDKFLPDGSTGEEKKVADEMHKILSSDIKVAATCVRVPVFIGHSIAVQIEFAAPLSADKARALLKKAPGITVVDHYETSGYITPAEMAGEDSVYVSRIREDKSIDNGLLLWVVGDNLRKGAALNAVQIAESLIAQKLI